MSSTEAFSKHVKFCSVSFELNNKFEVALNYFSYKMSKKATRLDKQLKECFK